MDRIVGNVMHRGVLTCRPTLSIQDVAHQMTTRDVSALVVVDSDESLIGLVSRTDLVGAQIRENQAEGLIKFTVKEIMVTDVVSVSANDTIEHASRLMIDHKIHRVVVTEECGGKRRPIGILSITDLVREMARKKD